MKNKILMSTLFLLSVFIFNGCERESSEELPADTQGWHMQGRDCLACHNVDLNEDKHLLIGGTLYKDENVENQDDISNTCGGKLLVNFLDSSLNTVESSASVEDTSSKGYDAKGNLFMLQRKLRLLPAGDYYVQITTEDGSVLAISSGPTHSFSSQDYDVDKSVDYDNRLSCNACHSNSGPQSPLFVQANKNLCK